MRRWKNVQYKENSKYHKRSLAGQKVWRSKYPAYQYQRDYRKTHPEYVMHNRDLQRECNKKLQRDHSTMIVKTHALLLQKNLIVNRNALSLQPSMDGVYALFKVKREKIVNRNALLLKRQ